MNTYNVVWTERMSVNVQANSEDEAIEMIMNGEFDEAGVSAEIDGSAEAYKMENLIEEAK